MKEIIKRLYFGEFNPCGEFRWSAEGSFSQIHSPHLHVGAPGIFTDLLRSFQMLQRVWGAESNGKLPHLFIPSKTAALVPEFAVEELPSAELQPWFLSLQWRTYPWAEYSWWLIISNFNKWMLHIATHLFGKSVSCRFRYIHYREL